MSHWKSIPMFILVTCVVWLAGPAAAHAADPPAEPAVEQKVPAGGVPRYIRPETPEQRQARLGTAEDPGMDPDPKKEFHRFGKMFTIFKVEKEFAKYTDEIGWVKPLGNVNAVREIYQENEKYIWVWDEVAPPADTTPIPQKVKKYSDEDLDYFRKLRDEFAPVEPADSGRSVAFEESSAGLPEKGSWRNGADVADMNGDGFLDIVAPPQRGAAGTPSIFLGDGKGGWKQWSITFPRRFNYGSVVVADFNKDKKQDLAFSVHLKGVAVFLGDGKGGFREVTEGLDTENFPTRRLVKADVDGDGWMDFVAISEGPVVAGFLPNERERQSGVMKQGFGNLRAYLNRGKGEKWEGINLSKEKEPIGGDYLVAANFNGDKYPDFSGASIYFNGVYTHYLSGKAKTYEPLVKGLTIPGRSYYHATTAGKFVRGAKTDDSIITFERHWPVDVDVNLVPLPPNTKATGIDRISFAGGEPKRETVVRWADARKIAGVASGDVDGDGNLDLAYVEGREVKILLGDGSGEFKRAAATGIMLPPQRTYDLRLPDFNGDKRADLMLMFESDAKTAFAPKTGSVKVWMNRGAAK